MIRWTTPTLSFTLPEGLECDWLMVTFKQLDLKIDKIVDGSAITERKFYVTFAQEETAQFEVNSKVAVQINLMEGTERIATYKDDLVVTENLYDAYIDPSTPTILEITENGTYDVSKYSTIIVNIGG